MDRPAEHETASNRPRPHIRLRQIMLGIGILVCLIYVFDYGIEWHRRMTLQHLVASVEALRVGHTTEAEVRELSERYRGRFVPAGEPGPQAQQPASYIISFSSPRLTIAASGHTLPGLRLWEVSLFLTVRKELLSEGYLRFLVIRSDGVVLAPLVSMAGQDPLLAPEGVTYFVTKLNVTGPPAEALHVELSPAATAEETRRAFNFNFSCLTAFRECRHICEVLPDAWKDLPPERRPPWDGREKLVDAECRERAH
jgi:hypothetical protein